ncbi:MAG: flagellar biosynthesis protein FlhF, partial [Planctomycetes bacterium]|nr:flagellar biosynthesis protein FlhF [Planctomycetota bacterium]
MKLKTFRAKTMAEALSRVKKEFGRDAVILSTRTIASKGVLGFGGQACVEITAARDHPALPPYPRRATIKVGLRESGPADGAAKFVSPVDQPKRRTASDTVLAELRDLRVAVSELARETHRAHVTDVPEFLFDSYRCLVQNEVAEQIARDLVLKVRRALSPTDLHTPEAVRRELASLMEKMLPTSGPIRCPATSCPVVIALIVPTGVGKTTTIAKLAASARLYKKLKVALITADTFRIGATEQLRAFAEILKIPMEVVYTSGEMKKAVNIHADKDAIFIDSTGRSPNDLENVVELISIVRAANPQEIHLVLSASTDQRTQLNALKGFGSMNVDSL